MDELKARLAAKGIEMLYKFKSGTTEVRGISFAKSRGPSTTQSPREEKSLIGLLSTY